MSHRFTFDSVEQYAENEAVPQYEVEITVECRDSDGADAEYVLEGILRTDTQEDVELCALSAADQAQLDKLAQACADAYAIEAYAEYCQGKADWEYDCWKDRMMEEASNREGSV